MGDEFYKAYIAYIKLNDDINVKYGDTKNVLESSDTDFSFVKAVILLVVAAVGFILSFICFIRFYLKRRTTPSFIDYVADDSIYGDSVSKSDENI